MKVIEELENIESLVLTGTGGDTTLTFPTSGVGSTKLPSTSVTLRSSGDILHNADIESVDAASFSAGTLAKSRGGIGASAADLIFPTSGIITSVSTGTIIKTWRTPMGESAPVVIDYSINGNRVTLLLRAFIFDTDKSVGTMTYDHSIAAITPVNDCYIPVVVISNVTQQLGMLLISHSQNFQLFYTLSRIGFPLMSLSGLPRCVEVTYSLD